MIQFLAESGDADLARLIQLIRQLNADASYEQEISENTRLIEDIGMTSINRLMLMSLIEREFGVNLGNHMQVLVKLRTIGEMAAFVSSLERSAADV